MLAVLISLLSLCVAAGALLRVEVLRRRYEGGAVDVEIKVVKGARIHSPTRRSTPSWVSHLDVVVVGRGTRSLWDVGVELRRGRSAEPLPVTAALAPGDLLPKFKLEPDGEGDGVVSFTILGRQHRSANRKVVYAYESRVDREGNLEPVTRA